MLTTLPMDASKMLGSRLARLFDRELIIEMLGMTQGQPEEFWVTQKRTVSLRFYNFLLNQLGLPLTTERDSLPVEMLGHLGLLAGHLMHNGLTYRDVRDWWQQEGAYLHKKQFAAKREQERLKSQCIKVLFLFETEKPRFLAFTEKEDAAVSGAVVRVPTLVPVEQDDLAHAFPVYSLTELTAESLREQALSFATLQKEFGANGVKLLVKHQV